jgi:hypothetical protein
MQKGALVKTLLLLGGAGAVALVGGAACAQAVPAGNAPAASAPQPVQGSLGDYDRRTEWSWQPVAIGAGGYIRGMVIHPRDNKVRYARADTWGAYRWNAATSRWVHMFTANSIPATAMVAQSNDPTKQFAVTAAPSTGGVDSIAVDPIDTRRVYLATTVLPPGDINRDADRNGNVYYSNNGGSSFLPSRGLTLRSSANPACRDAETNAMNTYGERLAVDPNNRNIVYLGSRLNGVFLSVNAARDFAPVSGGNVPGQCQYIINVLIDRTLTVTRVINNRKITVSKNIYLVSSSGTLAAVYRSADGGATWSNIANGIAEIAPDQVGGSAIDAAGNFWITASSKVLRYSKDGSWSVFTPPHAGQSIAVDPTYSGGSVYVSDWALRVSRSVNGGERWVDLGGPASYASSDSIDWINARVNHANAHSQLFYDPGIPTTGGKGRLWTGQGNDGTIYADLDESVQTDPAHGLAWKEQSKGIEQLVGQNIVLPPGNKNSAVVAAEDEGLFYVSNPRAFNAVRFDVDTSAKGNNDLVTNGMVAYIPDTPAVMVTNPANLFAGGYRGGPFKNNFASYSSNFGRNWQLFPSITLTDGDNSYGGGSITNSPPQLVGGQIAISARGTVFPGKGEARWTGQDNLVWLPFGSQYGYFGASNVEPYYSFDGGAHWSASTVYDEQGAVVDFTKNPFQLIFTSASKQFALTADPITPKTFYAVTVSNFMVTNDGGLTWRIPPGTSTAFAPAANFFINAQLEPVPGKRGDLWFTTGNGASIAGGYLFHTVDGGTSWTKINVAKAYNIAIGKGAPGKDYAFYMYGQPSSTQPFGVYRSDDKGVTWYLISGSRDNGYSVGSFNLPSHLAASQDVEGLVYISFSGMSYAYGYKKSLGNPYPAPK